MAGQPFFELQLAGQPKASKQVGFLKSRDFCKLWEKVWSKCGGWIATRKTNSRVECGGWIATRNTVGLSVVAG